MGVALREILAEFGIHVETDQLKKADGLIERVTHGIHKFGAAIAGGALAHAVAGFVESSVHMGEELEAGALRLGLSTEQLQQWQFAARGANVNTETLAGAMNFLNRNAAEAARGAGGPAAEAFRRLGISVKDSGGRIKDTNALMMETAAAIAAIPDPALRTSAAMDIFGRSGAELLPLLLKGESGIAALQEQVEEFGGGLSEEFVHAAAEAAAGMAKWDMMVQSVRSAIGEKLLPVVAKLITFAARIGAWFLKLAEHTHVIEAGLVVLASVILSSVIPALISLLFWLAPIVAPFVALTLVLSDLIGLFSSGQSVIGDFIDALFGVGTAQALVEDLTTAWYQLLYVIGYGAGVVVGFFDTLGAKWARIKEDFLTGWRAIKDGFSEAIDWVAAKWAAFVDFIQPVLDAIRNVTGSAGESRADVRRALDDAMYTGLGAADRGPERTGSSRTLDEIARANRGESTRTLEQIAAANRTASASRRGQTLAQIRQANRTHIEVHATGDAQQIAEQVGLVVERIQSEERQAALAALEPSVEGFNESLGG